jgi:hypothetical protein
MPMLIEFSTGWRTTIPPHTKFKKQDFFNIVSFHLIPDVIALPSTLRGTYHHVVFTIS